MDGTEGESDWVWVWVWGRDTGASQVRTNRVPAGFKPTISSARGRRVRSWVGTAHCQQSGARAAAKPIRVPNAEEHGRLLMD